MVRRFKLRLFFMPSFRFCRPKKPSFLVKSPKPRICTYIFSPINSRMFDTPYPGLPVPPPSTPTQCPFWNFESPVPLLKNEQNPYDSPVSDFPETRGEKNTRKGRNQRAKSKHRHNRSISSGGSGWFSSEEEESLLSSSSPSFESSFDLDCKIEHVSGMKQKKKDNLKIQKLKLYLSKSFKNTEKVNAEAAAVVKRSEDPFQDFKRSMAEMILEKQIFAVKDLEQLLLCFLSLNSQQHHAVIVAAFTEIWVELFSKSPMPQIQNLRL